MSRLAAEIARDESICISIDSAVGFAIRFRDRTRFVGSEVVPEILEVDPLARRTVLRASAVEAQMPDAGVVVNRPPNLHVRKESIRPDSAQTRASPQADHYDGGYC